MEPTQAPKKYAPDEIAAFELGVKVALDFALAVITDKPLITRAEIVEKLLEQRLRPSQTQRELREWTLPKSR